MKPDKVSICTLQPAQTTIVWNVLEQLTNQNVFVKIFNCGVNVKTKDFAGSRPFQPLFSWQGFLISPSINYGLCGAYQNGCKDIIFELCTK